MARRAPTFGEDFDEHEGIPSPSRRPAGVAQGTLSRIKAAPISYWTAVRQSIDEREGTRPDGSRNAGEAPAAWMGRPASYYSTGVQTPADDAGTPRAMWPPSAVVKEDRVKATAMWLLLLASFAIYIGFLSLSSLEMRKNPPVQIKRKDEPFQLPDVVLCPSTGDGCDSSDASNCLPMDWFLSAVEGFSECDKYFATPSPAARPTPSPADTVRVVSPGGADYFDRLPAPLVTPPAVVLLAIRFSLETRANGWCPRVPLSECAIDYDGIASGDLHSIHASFYVMWDDIVSSDSAPSTRRFINMFFVDQGVNVTDAVVAVRLPYDRVSITGTDPFTFLSNDVATTTAQHTLRLDTFEGEEYEGALLYATSSVNNFAFQSIEEIDPVDWWALAGSVGGMWEIICVFFGACFVARGVVGPDKKWGWSKSLSDGAGRRGCRCCTKRGGCKL